MGYCTNHQPLNMFVLLPAWFLDDPSSGRWLHMTHENTSRQAESPTLSHSQITRTTASRRNTTYPYISYYAIVPLYCLTYHRTVPSYCTIVLYPLSLVRTCRVLAVPIHFKYWVQSTSYKWVQVKPGTVRWYGGTVVRWYGDTLRFWLLPRRQPWSKTSWRGNNIKLWICDLWPTFITINITTIITIIIHHHIFLCNIISSLLLSFGPHRPHCCLLCLDCQKRWILRGLSEQHTHRAQYEQFIETNKK